MGRVNIKKFSLILAVALLSSLFALLPKDSVSAWSQDTCNNWFKVNDVSSSGVPNVYSSFYDTPQAEFACRTSTSNNYEYGAMFVTGIPATSGGTGSGSTLNINSYIVYDPEHLTQYLYLTGGFYTRGKKTKGYVYGGQAKVRTCSSSSSSSCDQDNIVSVSGMGFYDGKDSSGTYVGNYVYRGYNPNSTDTWVLGDNYRLAINADEFYDTKNGGLQTQNDKIVYRYIGMYRCWVDSPTDAPPIESQPHGTGSCGWQMTKVFGKKRPAKTTYKGTSTMKDGSTTVANNSTVTLNSPSKTITFTHKITRNDNGDDEDDDETYLVNSSSPGKGLTSRTKGFGRGKTKSILEEPLTVDLDPGKSKVIWQLMKFQSNNWSNELDGRANIECEISGYEAKGRACVKLKRPYAKFTGSVTPTVTSADGGTDYTISGGRAKVTSADGKYKITFINRVDRTKDGAGGTVGSPWDTKTTKDGAQLETDSQTVNLTEEHGSNVATYEYTGTLRYGESITYCSNLNYTHTVTGTEKRAVSSCVTVWRENAKCELDNSFTYGLNTAVNTGRIGVGVKYGNVTSNTAYTKPNSLMEVSVYARPTDQVKFYHEMCAGVLYPIKERGINKEVKYTASGASTKSYDTGNKYLFRNSVPMVGTTYNNPRTWSSSSAGANEFLSSVKHVESKWESPDSGAGKNYQCGSVGSGWYQIAGKESCARTGDYNIGVLDAGSTISQYLSWNDQTFDNGSFGNNERVATANVIVPYNYILKPYVQNLGTSKRVAYLGETVSMVPGVVVAPRPNTAVSSNTDINTYATITKKTSIRVDYYYTDSTGNMKDGSRVTVYSKDNVRLNNESDLNGTGGREEFIENGGSKLSNSVSSTGEFSIPVSDSSLKPGDRVCMRIRVWPADSHNDLLNVAVGASDVALSETGAGESSARATASCITVAKRPTMSVEGSNTYSATTVKTSRFSKELGGTKFYFGSWSEYGVFARVNTGSFLMASGAAYGYSKDGYKDASGNYTKLANIPRVNPSGSANVATENNANDCTFMTQTFANAECNSGTHKIGDVAAEQFSERIAERYSRGSVNVSNAPSASGNYSSYMNLNGYSDGGVLEDGGAIVIRPSANAYISDGWKPNIPNSVYETRGIKKGNNTVVYSMPDKTIAIGGNINNQSNELSSPGQVSGVVIIADKVLIASNVTYINATIVANEVNTCAFKDNGEAMTYGGLKWTGSDSYPCAKSLRFDAPVVTKRLILNRTAGANNGTQSIMRAEIFNYNAAQLLWSFSQMSRYNQAITTYSRELPPRY